MIIAGIAIGIITWCLYSASRCFFRVGEGSVGVLVNFGAAVADRPGGPLLTFGPGLHTKRPWQKVIEVPVMEQSLELSGDEGGQTAMAADGTVLRFDSILRYSAVAAEIEHYLFGMKSPREHITGLFTCLLRNEIADFQAGGQAGGRAGDSSTESGGADPRGGGSYGLIRRERKELNRRIEEFCHKEIGRRNGLHFSAVDLTDILPPDELADALNAVMQAQSEAEAELSRCEAECRQRVIAAEQGVLISRARAEAAEQEITVLCRQLGELQRAGTLSDYVARRRSEVLSQSKSLFLRR